MEGSLEKRKGMRDWTGEALQTGQIVCMKVQSQVYVRHMWNRMKGRGRVPYSNSVGK